MFFQFLIINKTLQEKEFDNIGVSLFEYDTTSMAVSLLRPIKNVRNASNLSVNKPHNDTFWCYWRDMSQYELFHLLELSFKYSENNGDIYSSHIFKDFGNELQTGKTLTWEGKKRKAASANNLPKLKQNYKIPLNQMDLWNPSTGKLTERGHKLLQIGKLYGPNSQVFLSALTYLLLVDGKHLELIKRVEEFQQFNIVPKDSDSFLLALENDLQTKGYIGSRKPKAKKNNGTSKPSFIRDEPKVWNKLNLLKMKGKRQYFFPGKGYEFDWHYISDVLIEGQKILLR